MNGQENVLIENEIEVPSRHELQHPEIKDLQEQLNENNSASGSLGEKVEQLVLDLKSSILESKNVKIGKSEIEAEISPAKKTNK